MFDYVSEQDYKLKFINTYFQKCKYELESNKVDVVIKDNDDQPILYIESKSWIDFENQDLEKLKN